MSTASHLAAHGFYQACEFADTQPIKDFTFDGHRFAEWTFQDGSKLRADQVYNRLDFTH